MSKSNVQKIPVQRGPMQIIQLAMLAAIYWLLLKGQASEWWVSALLGALVLITAYTLWQEWRGSVAEASAQVRLFFWTKVVAFIAILGLMVYQYLG